MTFSCLPPIKTSEFLIKMSTTWIARGWLLRKGCAWAPYLFVLLYRPDWKSLHYFTSGRRKNNALRSFLTAHDRPCLLKKTSHSYDVPRGQKPLTGRKASWKSPLNPSSDSQLPFPTVKQRKHGCTAGSSDSYCDIISCRIYRLISPSTCTTQIKQIAAVCIC